MPYRTPNLNHDPIYQHWDQIPWTRRICLQHLQRFFQVPQLVACFDDPTEQPFVNDCIMAIEFLNSPPGRGLVPAQAALLIHYHIKHL